MKVDIRKVFDGFNASKFVVYLSLMVFSFLLALRLDNTIVCSYWLIFTPLWIWKLLVLTGAVGGFATWLRNPLCRQDPESNEQCRAMLVSACLNLLLLLFELLACDKLESDRPNHYWILIFTPLIFLSIISIGTCVWAMKKQHGFELEFFFSVNILQFVFLALKLDGFIRWSWVILFIPMWILMCVCLVLVVYLIILAIILFRSADIGPEQRRGNIRGAFSSGLAIVLLLTFEVMLSTKLDLDAEIKQRNQAAVSDGQTPRDRVAEVSQPFVVVVLPLIATLLVMMSLSFGKRPNNQWWFGIRKDFCVCLLQFCPVIREYGNVYYKTRSRSRSNGEDGDGYADELDMLENRTETGEPRLTIFESTIVEHHKPVVPLVSIYSPD